MAVTKAAKKAARQNPRRRIRNLQKKDRIKSLLKQVKNLASRQKIEEAKKLLPLVYKALDKAAKTGLIKKNTADRTKSRITRLIFREQKTKSREQ